MTEILFLLTVIGIAVAGSLAAILIRVSRESSTAPVDRDEVNLAIANDNRQMLASSLPAEEAAVADTEVDGALLDDVSLAEKRQLRRSRRWPFLLTGILIPLFALGLYWFSWGEPGTVLLEEAASYLESQVNEANSRRVVERIEDYVSIHPENQKAWVSLMSFQWLLGDRDSFRETHKAAELEGHISPFGDSLYLLDAFRLRQLNLTSRDRLVQERLRTLDAGSQVLAMLDAIEHTGRGDLHAANRAWEDVLSQSDLFELHQMALLGQRATRMRLEESSHPKIVVSVSLEEPFPDMQWLFVYAKSAVNQPPLAVVKRPLRGQRRFDLTLDDSVVMQPDSLLSAAQQVFVTARLSTSPDALAKTNDLQVTSAPVDAKRQPRVTLPFGTLTPIVKVKVSADTQMSPVESVFIIVKERVVSGPPIAVRRIYGPLLDEVIDVTLADVMIPTLTATATDDLEVFARFSRSTSAIARPGDVESLSVPFDLGSTVELTLDQPIGDELHN